MPVKGFSVITVREGMYEVLVKRAEANKRSVRAELEVILEECGVIKPAKVKA